MPLKYEKNIFNVITYLNKQDQGTSIQTGSKARWLKTDLISDQKSSEKYSKTGQRLMNSKYFSVTEQISVPRGSACPHKGAASLGMIIKII